MDNLLIKELMNSNNFWTLNKKLVASLGIEETFLISVMAEAEKLLADSEGWFYQTNDTLESFTGIKKDRQLKIIKKLISKGVLIKELRGLPRKRYFKFNYENIRQLVDAKCDDCKKENAIPSSSKTRHNKESIINNIDKENIKKSAIAKVPAKKLSVQDKILENLYLENISKDLENKIVEFLEYKKTIKKPYKTYRPIKSMINGIGSKFKDEEHLIKSIDNSMDNEYQGVFPTKDYKKESAGIEDSFASRYLRGEVEFNG